MGWSIYIKTDRDIKENDVNDIIENLQETYSYPNDFGIKIRQQWGWIAAVDVSIRDKNTVMLSGSYSQSGAIAEEFSAYFQEQLQVLDYQTETRFNW
ncbi:hypothetical protein [Paenibacillus tianjinensis]|uniref:Uncharacterized protein n=1 Tax=Paenibacillus tianjinensis TaxID=2810347 RepID=A0ABX7LAF0_9BACL|nr:hypothetical protein [Paenibacillus tianjinensis]QSF43420.1 hypothetical protein JRJ22_19340 [Paenibacillus tianjinensis]